MNIVIAGQFNFPDRTAAASRIRHLAQGLTENGNNVSVISMVARKTDQDQPDPVRWIDLSGFRYLLAAGWQTPGMRRGLVQRVVNLHRSLRRAMRSTLDELELMHRHDRVHVVIIYSELYPYMRPLIAWCRRNGVLLVRDVVEWFTSRSFVGGCLSPMYWAYTLDFRRLAPLSDAVIGISRLLTDHFSRLKIPSICIPAIIDPGRWSTDAGTVPARDDAAFHVTYLGDMANRDGPMIMMHAIRRVLSAGHDVFFDVVGSAGVGQFGHEAKALAESDPVLRGHVKFWGRVSDDEVRAKLSGSDALLFTRLSGRAAQAAFPTRLPEYLMSGRPVIASAVGDIPRYLEDGREAILVTADSEDSLADGILRLLAMPDHGRAVGEAGRRKCLTCFDYRTRCQELTEFLRRLKE